MRVAGLWEFLGNAVDDAAAEFRRVAGEFDSAYSNLLNRGEWAAQSPYAAEYSALASRAQSAKSTVDYIAGLLRTALDWAGIGTPSDLQGLAVGPAAPLVAIPAAAIVGSIAIISAVTGAVVLFLDKTDIDYQKWRAEKGLPPDRKGGVAGGIADAAFWTVLAIGAALALPQLFKK